VRSWRCHTQRTPAGEIDSPRRLSAAETRTWPQADCSIADIAYQNKAVVYDLLLKTAAGTLITIAADPKYLGARTGLTAVHHTWGSALTHHPHAHIIVPGGGLSPDGEHWIACRPGFFLSIRGLSRLFRRLLLERLTAAYQAGRLQFFADQAALAAPAAFQTFLAALRKVEWLVYAKRPFGGPDAVLAYLSRYMHRVAIANSRLVAFDGERMSFRWKDYRAKADARHKLMTLDVDEFIRRFLIHVLPDGFRRIRHYGLFANANRAGNIALARHLLGMPAAPSNSDSDGAKAGHPDEERNTCPCCGGRMVIIETFEPGCQPRLWPLPSIGLDSS
jgi:Putative transposase